MFSTNLLTKILIFENPKGKNFVFSVSMVSLKTDCHDSEIGGGLGPRISCGTSPLLMSRAIFREGRPRKRENRNHVGLLSNFYLVYGTRVKTLGPIMIMTGLWLLNLSEWREGKPFR